MLCGTEGEGSFEMGPHRHARIWTGVRMQRTAFIGLIVLEAWILSCGGGRSLPRGVDPTPGRYQIELLVDGLERSYLVYVPREYDARTPLPLVLMLHGGGGTARAALWETGWDRKADEAGFLVALPNASPPDPSRRPSFARNPQLWNDGSDRFYERQAPVDDVHFVALLLEDLAARFAVDPAQIFVTGFSNGASMTFLLGTRLSDRLAAIAPVAGACWVVPGRLAKPIPMLYITGAADPLNLIEGGPPRLASGGSDPVRAKPKPPVRESVLRWVRALGCDDSEGPSTISDDQGVHTETYCPSPSGPQIVYTVVDDLGHTWAGGRSLLPARWVGPRSDALDATDVIWQFFRSHSKASPAR